MVSPDYDEKLAQHLANNAGKYSIAASAGFWIPVWHNQQLEWHPGRRLQCPLRLRSPIGTSNTHVLDLVLDNGGIHKTDTLDLSHHLGGTDVAEDAAQVRGAIRHWLWLEGEDAIEKACGPEWVPLGLHDVMGHHGFSEQMTGGGCTGWERVKGGGAYTLITEAEDPSHPMDWLLPVTVGHYDKDGDQLGELETGLTLAQYVQKEPPSAPAGRPDVQTALDFINRHRATIHQAQLDPAEAGWGSDDILIEAERIRRLSNPFADAKARLLAW